MDRLQIILLVFKRFRSNLGLAILSVVGVALTVGAIASIPIFSDSVGFQILNEELTHYAIGSESPPLAIRYYRVPSSPKRMTVQEALDTGKWLAHLTASEVGIRINHTYTQIGSPALMIRAPKSDTRYTNTDLIQTRINCIPGVEKHIRILEGEPLSSADTASMLYVWLQPEFMNKLGLHVGDEMELFSPNAIHPEIPLRFRVAGTWEAIDASDPFWYRDPAELMNEEFLTTVDAFQTYIAPYTPQQVDYSYWYCVLDANQLRFRDVDRYIRGVELAKSKAETTIPTLRVDYSPIEPLLEVQGRTRILTRLLFGFSLPIIALLLYFIGIISSITVQYQIQQTAILVSRGATKSQLLFISFMDGLITIILGLPLGLLLCIALVYIMGMNSSFLAFNRQPFPVAMQALDWRTIVLALGISLFARLIPTLHSTRHTIVSYGRTRARYIPGNTMTKLVLSVVLVSITYYAYYLLKGRGTLGIVSLDPTSEIARDPLLYIAPALFIITSGWILAQIFPFLLRIPDALGSIIPGVSVYMCFRNLARHGSDYTAPIFLLAICLCLGSFEASIAKSADRWLVDRRHYQVGADYTFELAAETQGPEAGAGLMSWLLPPSDYEQLPGVISATRVGIYPAVMNISGISKIRVIGIDRLDFPKVVYWRPDYASESLGSLMNRLGAKPDGVLVSNKMLHQIGLQVGDMLAMDVILEVGVTRMQFVIVGTFDYFPTVYEETSPAVVVNLDTIFENIGTVEPYSVWLRTQPDIDISALQEQIEGMGIVTTNEVDCYAMIKEDSASLERVGIFGNLSAGFITCSLVAWLGLLIHTFASLSSRVKSFAITRAMGMSMKQIFTTVSLEYLIVTLYSVLGGALCGLATSILFVPYYQFTENPRLQVPPFLAEIASEQIKWIVIGYLIVLLLAEGVVLFRLLKSKLSQVLRLGEGE